MGKKIFVSYKYADNQVKPLNRDIFTTVRDYVTEFEHRVDKTDHIYKGEHDDEDLSKLSDETIWGKLKDRIYDSSVTIVFISPIMKEKYKKERDQWIPWEISYSLKETSRKSKKGDSITSKSNAMLAVVLPDKKGDYSYYLEAKNCCLLQCTMHHTYKLFSILKNNKFNQKKKMKCNCPEKENVWQGCCSYIEAVRWCDFINNINYYIKRAIERQDNIDDYDIQKDIE